MNKRKKTECYVSMLLIVSALLFVCTVKARAPWFGQLSNEGHSGVTASMVKYAKNWCREGPASLYFGIIENPASVECLSWKERFVYSSILPGPLVPIYLLAKVTGDEPSPASVMTINLANHFVLTFLVALLAFTFLLSFRWRPVPAAILALAPIPLVLLLPLPYYNLQNVYYCDEPVLVPFVLAVLLEFLRDTSQTPARRNTLSFFQGTVTVYGLFMNWPLFVPFGAALFLKRLALGEMGRSAAGFFKCAAAFAIPYLISFLFFAFQLWMLGGWPRLVERVFQRTGLDNADSRFVRDFHPIFWKQHVVQAFGAWAPYCVLAAAVLLVALLTYAAARRLRGRNVSRNLRSITVVLYLILVPCLMKTYLLREHSAVHFFTALKYVVVIGIAPFVLLPALILEVTQTLSPGQVHWLRKPAPKLLLSLGLLVAATSLAIREHPRAAMYFTEPNPDYEKVGTFLAQHTGFNDIVFSPDFRIPDNPPQYLCYSMKRVYSISSIYDIYEMTHAIEADYTVNLFSREETALRETFGIERLLEEPQVLDESGAMSLRKVSKKAFLAICREAGITASDGWDTSQNLLKNGGFELGDGGLDGWKRDETAPDVHTVKEEGQNPPEDQACLRIEYIETEGDLKPVLLEQRVDLEGSGGLYGVRFQIRRKYVGGWLEVALVDAAPQGYQRLYFRHFIHPDFRATEWLPVSFVVQVPKETKSLRFQLRRPTKLPPTERTATVWLDDVKLIRLRPASQ